jgi:alpha,alpha-trehalase
MSTSQQDDGDNVRLVDRTAAAPAGPSLRAKNSSSLNSSNGQLAAASPQSTTDYSRHGDVTIDVDTPKAKTCRAVRIVVVALILVIAVAVAIIAFAMKRHDNHGVVPVTIPPPPAPPADFVYMKNCRHPVYCTGPILDAVQRARFQQNQSSDQKTFVDMPIMAPSINALNESWHALDMANGTKNNTRILEWVAENFGSPESIIQRVTPVDFIERPAFIDGIKDATLGKFGQNVHNIWKNLSREYNFTGLCSECYSALDLPHPFVVPGGRFREFYYWDSFWILRGLLISELNQTAYNIVDNIASQIEKYGFMPNGARVYYLDRSQPPVFPLMVDLYVRSMGGVNAPGNAAVLPRLLQLMAREHMFWRYNINSVNFTIPGQNKSVTMFRYNTTNTAPRPESYIEDEQAFNQTTNRTAADFYSNIAAGAETGWDFSTRWFMPGSENMSDIIAAHVIPVDLNTILLRDAEIIRDTAIALNQPDVAQQFSGYVEAYRETLISALRWSDFNDILLLPNGSVVKRTGFYAALAVVGWSPTIVANLSTLEKDTLVTRLLQNINVSGMPTSEINSTQQWDFPNAWPPLQWFTVEAFDTLGRPDLAMDLRTKWVRTNYCFYAANQYMSEKYSAVSDAAGKGGEYTDQEGFGWTNGVLLDFLTAIGANATTPSCV